MIPTPHEPLASRARPARWWGPAALWALAASGCSYDWGEPAEPRAPSSSAQDGGSSEIDEDDGGVVTVAPDDVARRDAGVRAGSPDIARADAGPGKSPTTASLPACVVGTGQVGRCVLR